MPGKERKPKCCAPFGKELLPKSKLPGLQKVGSKLARSFQTFYPEKNILPDNYICFLCAKRFKTEIKKLKPKVTIKRSSVLQ